VTAYLTDQVGALVRLVARGGTVALTGAGLSTESGIPDYRGPSGLARQASPMTIQDFTRGVASRRRYWARSHLGWARMSQASPNAGHQALADLEARGLLAGIITQNVDGLHAAAGSRQVIDLHGRLDRVICLECGTVVRRAEHSARLAAANAHWQARAGAMQADGDMDLDDADIATFVVVDCEQCGGVLKPDVIYFGESVPADRVVQAFAMVEEASALLVLGSSLTVYSGRRFVTRAAELEVPIAIVNEGATRCDELATVRIEAPLGATLAAVAERCGARGVPARLPVP
jgi:NAD-dependent SIR2 family protein deacetylase